MVGLSLALCLRARLGGEARILLVEESPLPAGERGFGGDDAPSFDARSTALSYGSRLIYEDLGLWPALTQGACPIKRVHVSEGGRFGNVLLDAAEQGWPALGYVLENAHLGRGLLEAVRLSGVAVRSPARVVDVTVEAAAEATVKANCAKVLLDNGESLRTELLLIAEGADSSLCHHLGIVRAQRTCQQSAVIANVAHERPHANTAYERFTRRGPLAFLPLPPLTEPHSPTHTPITHRSALVWSVSSDFAASLMELDDAGFLTTLQRAFGDRLGTLLRAGRRRAYPLALGRSREQVRSCIAVMGNAAHALHPVGGQGFNLALRDVASLGNALGQAQAEGRPLGDLDVLQAYLSQQAADQAQTAAFSDYLPGLFAPPRGGPGFLRGLGLCALDLSPALKEEFIRRTAGVAASAGYRDARP